ncbi:hypothetical protein BaRGS_00029769, partial [Batillaria attramentaria]
VGGHQDIKDPQKLQMLEQALSVLDTCHILHLVPAWFSQALKDDLRHRILPGFWRFFQPSTDQMDSSSVSSSSPFAEAINYLYEVTESYRPCLKYVTSMQELLALKTAADDRDRGDIPRCPVESLESQLVMLYKAYLFFTFPKCFKDAVEAFYAQAFNAFHRSNPREDDSFETSMEEDGNVSKEDVMERFSDVNKKLFEMGILEHVSGSAVTSLIHDHIRHHIHAKCRGNFETSYREHLETWLDTKVLNWLHLIYGIGSAEKMQSINAFRDRLMHFIWETYANTLIEQLFNIIIEFPESEPAVRDLRICLEKIDLRSHLVLSLRNALESRLLHPGVNTADILTAYISAIRALRVLDPAGVILELVCQPVKKYLRSREDTVRCIVSSLTDEGSSELMDELIRGAPQSADETGQADGDAEDWEAWEPDPVDANPDTASKRRQEQDIISTLVNVYGSQELFVAEYRTLLADRLLTQASSGTTTTAAGSTSGAGAGTSGAGGDLERELRYLELLKLRFGEAPLHGCQVMLKDVADSRRINSRIAEVLQQSGESPEVDVSAMILSAQFWPSFREEKITLPEQLQSCLDAFTQQYEMLKGNRTLCWKPHLGVMNIEIELKDQTLNFSVSPVHAAIIMQFQEKERWTVEGLGRTLEMAPSAVRRKLAYWQGQGLVKEEQPDVFVLVEERRAEPQEVIATDEDEMESAMASAAQQREQEMQMFWTYITGMLQNLDCLPLERIHSMLRMFAVQGPESGEFTQAQLKAFLDRKVREQQLTYSGGVYRLPKH